MKKTNLLVLLFLLVPGMTLAAAAPPAEGGAAHLEVAAPAGPGLVTTPDFSPSFELDAAPLAAAQGKKPEKCFCIATAYCEYGAPVISCSDSTSPCQCESSDQSCPEIPGHVKCNGVKTTCEECPWQCEGCPPYCDGDAECFECCPNGVGCVDGTCM